MAEMQKQGRPNDAKADEWEQDLHPNSGAGTNRGMGGALPENSAPSAAEIKALHNDSPGYTDDELRQIIVFPPGTRLKQGAAYLDLSDRDRQPFTAMGNMEVEANHYYVPKTEVSYEIWNRLIGQNS